MVSEGKTVKVVTCTCAHDYQDQKYGHKQRLANKTWKGWRCTVCGKDHLSKG